MNPTSVRLARRPLWTLVLTLLFGLLSSSVWATDYYLTVAGAGSKTGADWADAYDVSSLWTVVNSTMQPGDTLYLGGAATSGGTDYGDTRLTISSGGTSTGQKSLIGVDLGYGYPKFIGPQTVRSYTTITLADTVGYWTIKNLYIEHRDMGLATSGSGHPGLVIDGVIAHDIKSSCFSFADCDGILVQNCRSERYSELGFMFANACDGVTVQNCVADCTGTGDVDDPAWRSYCSSPVGFNFHIKNSSAAPNTNILLEDCTTLNNDEDTADTGDYEQGDGFKMEASNDGVTFLRCMSYNNQDAAYDLKGSNQTLQDCVAVNNARYGFKLWYDGALTNCVSVNNGARQMTLPATTGGHTISADHCTFHCNASPQAGVVIETSGNIAALTNCIISFGGTAGTYTAGPGTFSLNGTVKLANTANTANNPMYIDPTLPWDGIGDNFDNQTYGPLKGYNSLGLGGGPTTIVVDDADSTGVTITGSWTVSTSTSGYYGSDYRQDGNTGQGTKSVRFTPTIPSAGTYEVFLWWTAGSNRASNTPVDVVHSGGTDYQHVDQRSSGGQWVLLGTYAFDAGTAGSVLVANTGTDGYVVADAVKFVEVAPPEIIMDNTDSTGVTVTGTWVSSTFTAGYYGSDYLHDDNTGKGTKSVRFTPTITTTGSYEVFARWTAGSTRASNVPVDIVNADGTEYLSVNQRYNGGEWVSLGVYNFNAGTAGSVLIATTGTNGYVIVDAVRFVKTQTLPEIIVDNADSTGVSITGGWTSSTYSPGYYGGDYLHDGNTGKGTKSVRFTPTIPTTGDYEVFGRWIADSNRASNVPFDITRSGGTDTVLVDQRYNGGTWVSLGVYAFDAGTAGNVLIRTTGTSGYVIADAIRLVPR